MNVPLCVLSALMDLEAHGPMFCYASQFKLGYVLLQGELDDGVETTKEVNVLIPMTRLLKRPRCSRWRHRYFTMWDEDTWHLPLRPASEESVSYAWFRLWNPLLVESASRHWGAPASEIQCATGGTSWPSSSTNVVGHIPSQSSDELLGDND